MKTLAQSLSQIAPAYNAREHTRAAERMVEDMNAPKDWKERGEKHVDLNGPTLRAFVEAQKQEKNTHTPGPLTTAHHSASDTWQVCTDAPLSMLLARDIVNEADATLYASAPDLLAELGAMLRLVDGLPWQTRDAVYKAFNERTGGLPGSLPKPIAAARAAIAKARAK